MSGFSRGSIATRCAHARSSKLSVVRISDCCDPNGVCEPDSKIELGYDVSRVPPGVCRGALVACGSTLRLRRGVLFFSGVAGSGSLLAIRLTPDGVGVLSGGAVGAVAEVCRRRLVGVTGMAGTAKTPPSSFSFVSAFLPFFGFDFFVGGGCSGSKAADNLRF